MSYLIDNAQKLNDIIFANRNKAYGAYAIRSSYGETVLKSLGMMIFGIGFIFGIAFYLSHKNDPNKLSSIVTIHDSVYVIPVYFPPEEIKKPEDQKITEPAAPPSKAMSSALSSNISDSLSVEKSDTSFNINKTTSSITVIDPNGNGTTSNTAAITNTASGNKVKAEIKGGFEVDTQPEFEGGLAALYRFIGSQLIYPEVASREGQEGKGRGHPRGVEERRAARHRAAAAAQLRLGRLPTRGGASRGSSRVLCGERGGQGLVGDHRAPRPWA
jgi:protein TonB